jgi:hypothetical protein
MVSAGARAMQDGSSGAPDDDKNQEIVIDRIHKSRL